MRRTQTIYKSEVNNWKPKSQLLSLNPEWGGLMTSATHSCNMEIKQLMIQRGLPTFDVHWHVRCRLAVSGRSSQEESSRSSLPTLTASNNPNCSHSPADIKGNHPTFVCCSLSLPHYSTHHIISPVTPLCLFYQTYAVRSCFLIPIKRALSVRIFAFIRFR